MNNLEDALESDVDTPVTASITTVITLAIVTDAELTCILAIGLEVAPAEELDDKVTLTRSEACCVDVVTDVDKPITTGTTRVSA